MRTPIVTIITPTYNHEKFISQCLDSVISQTFSDWEQIIVDDGSTDKTRAIIESYKDDRIKLISQNNKGISRLRETYNTALAEAKGMFIAVLEGDDYWSSDKLSKQLPLFDNPEIDLVWGRVAWVDVDCKHVATVPDDINQYKDLNRYQYLDKLLLVNFIPAVTVVLRKDTLLAVGGFQQPPNMVTVDYPTWLECIKFGEVAVSEDTVGFWRRHPTQMSTARQHEILNNTMEFALNFYNALSVNDKSKLVLNSDAIKSNWRKHISESCFYEGRKRLIRKQWLEAKNEFMNSYKYSVNVNKIKSLLGLTGAVIHKDIEIIAKLTGKDKITDDELMI